MSWYLPDHLTNKSLHFMRLSTMHKSISIGLLCSVGTAVILPVAQAATMGKTIVTSVQHQPLAASINVTGIRSADFSASLADSVVYHQMGLIPTASMSAKFLPLSIDTGVIVLNSIQPIAMPFTDVVLAINDQGQRQIIPKTLLLPLVNRAPIEQASATLATIEKTAPSTLTINAHTARPLVVKRIPPLVLANGDSVEPVLNANVDNNANNNSNNKTTAKPANKTPTLAKSKTNSPQILVVSRQAPPQLFVSPKPIQPTLSAIEPVLNANNSNNKTTAKPANKTPTLAESKTNSPQILVASRQAPPPLFASPKPVQPSLSVAEPVFNASQDSDLPISKTPALPQSKTNSPQILVASSKDQNTTLLPNNAFSISERSVNITTNIHTTPIIDDVKPLTAANKTAITPIIEITSTPKVNYEPIESASRSTSYPSLNTKINRKIMIMDLDFRDIVILKTLSTRDNTPKPLTKLSISSKKSIPNYIVQKNDNLWVISQQIAKQNKLDVIIVMNQVKSQNPNAFINKNSNRLKANASLDLSYYDSIPTKESLQTAIADNRQQTLESFNRV